MSLHPTDYPVVPLRYTQHQGKWAVMMPYPVTQPEDARCLNDDAFTEDLKAKGASLQYMRDKCNSCPLMVACREYGIAHDDHFMTGGLTPKEKRQVRADRGQLLVEPLRAFEYGLGENWFSMLMDRSGGVDDGEDQAD